MRRFRDILEMLFKESPEWDANKEYSIDKINVSIVF